MSSRSVVLAIARRNLAHAFKNPALLVPSITFPLIFLVAFAGGLSALDKVPGFDYKAGYTAFQYIFVLLQSAAFGGIFTAFGIAADFESGFARRILVATPRRSALLVGYAVSAVVRYTFTVSLVTLAAVLAGMHVDGSAEQLAGLYCLGLLVSLAATMFSAGLALRAQTLQVGPLMQIPIFIMLFLAPVYVPLHLLKGWVHTAATVNPATALLTAGRGLLAGTPDKTALAFACGAGLVLVFSWYALRGLRRAERGA